VNPGLAAWTREVAGALDAGFALTIDYGHEADRLYSPERAGGTLQTTYRHAPGSGPYDHIGEQDITAHVDFSALVAEGEAAGLRPLALLTQSRFLRGHGLDRWRRMLGGEGLTQRERDANTMGMLDLVRPEGLGGFKVLVQEKGTGIEDVGRLLAPEALRPGDLPVPLLGPEHLSLIEARYPHAAWDPADLWPWPDPPSRSDLTL
jgi:SAM-dependent MidA family methyltransferase